MFQVAVSLSVMVVVTDVVPAATSPPVVDAGFEIDTV